MKRAHWFGLALFALFAVAIALPAIVTADKTCDTTYDNFGKAFMQKYCVSCHDSTKVGPARHGIPDTASYDNPDNIKKDKKAIVKMVVDKGKMPPMPPMPTDDEKSKVKAWLTCEY